MRRVRAGLAVWTAGAAPLARDAIRLMARASVRFARTIDRLDVSRSRKSLFANVSKLIRTKQILHAQVKE
jgi:hypothetical protein